MLFTRFPEKKSELGYFRPAGRITKQCFKDVLTVLYCQGKRGLNLSWGLEVLGNVLKLVCHLKVQDVEDVMYK